MTEREVLEKYPEWFYDYGVRVKNCGDDVIRVTRNLASGGGNWHRYKYHLEKLWIKLNPITVRGS